MLKRRDPDVKDSPKQVSTSRLSRDRSKHNQIDSLCCVKLFGKSEHETCASVSRALPHSQPKAIKEGLGVSHKANGDDKACDHKACFGCREAGPS